MTSDGRTRLLIEIFMLVEQSENQELFVIISMWMRLKMPCLDRLLQQKLTRPDS